MPSPNSRAPGAVSFEQLGVPVALCKVLADAGITTPFAIQAATIADALAGRDVSGRAPTGSGKTLAFGVPVAARVTRAEPRHPTALVLVPTRELADQVAAELRPLADARSRRVHAFYGGVSFAPQLRALRRGVDVAVACPGRLADLVNQREVHLDRVALVVVDEADRMADMGFLPEVQRLLDRTLPDRQTLLFSATLDGDVDVLVKRYQRRPVRHEVHDPDEGTVRGTHHHWVVDRQDRVEACADAVAAAGPTVVFVRTRHGADRLTRQLAKAGIRGVAIHGDRSQAQRTRALDAFAGGRAEALVATDVAARGIHVDDVACVVHYDLPTDPKDYVHRSGRTARAGAEGVVVALVLPEQRKAVAAISRALSLDVEAGPVDILGAFGRTGQRQPRGSQEAPAARSGPTVDEHTSPTTETPPRRGNRTGGRAPASGRPSTRSATRSSRRERARSRDWEARAEDGAPADRSAGSAVRHSANPKRRDGAGGSSSKASSAPRPGAKPSSRRPSYKGGSPRPATSQRSGSGRAKANRATASRPPRNRPR